MRSGTLVALTGALTALALLLPGAASAAAPGKIAFVSNADGDDDIFVMNADGSGQTPVSPNSTFNDFSPNWSPDGKQILFTSGRSGAGNDDLWVMNADGSNPRQLTVTSDRELQADWSPDGSRIVFTRQDGASDYAVFIMNADGSAQTPLVNPATPEDAYGAHFSPDGQWIVFTADGPGSNDDVGALIKPDGSGQISLTSPGVNVYSPDFTADGKRIVFWNENDGDREVYSMATNGTDIRNLTNTPTVPGVTDQDFGPAPSWEGLNRIAFSSQRGGDQEIWLMNADGSGVTQLTNTTGDTRSPNFQPTVTCQGKVATIVGTAASETLTGGPSADIISGQGGKDQISGLDGNDIVCGDAGKDTLRGGKGKDILNGGPGKDRTIGGKGKDRCIGGKGKDSAKACEKLKKIP